MKQIVLIIGMWIAVLPAIGQKERKYIREGNQLFEKQDFEKAEVEYRKAADQKAGSFEADFNMADALYKQQKYEEALQQFSALAKRETDKQRLGEIYHNIGNTLLSMQKTDESIEAYKESLRNRPEAEETKYNLEFARYKQQEQQKQDQQNKDQQNQDQQNQDQKDQNQKDQNQDQQNQDQNQENKDQQNQDQNQQDQQNKDQQNKDQDKKDQQNQDQNKEKKDQQNQQGQQPQEGKISKEDAERLLEALQKDEKQVQEKVQKQKVQEQKAKKMKIEKDW